MTRFIIGDDKEAKVISIKAEGEDVNIECEDKLVAWFRGEDNSLVIDNNNLEEAGLKHKHN